MSNNLDRICTVDISLASPISNDANFDNILILGPAPANPTEDVPAVGVYNRIESVLRKVPWDNGMRRGRCDFTCFSAENAVKLLCRRPAPYAAIRWLEDEVIPKTQEMGEEVARTYPAWNKKPAQKELTEPPQSLKPEPEAFKREPLQAGGGALIERLDNIILECVLLKKELSKAK